MKIVWFIAFIAVFAVYSLAVTWLWGLTVLKSMQPNKRGQLGIVEFAPIFVTSIFIIASILLTTHGFDASLVAGILVVTLVSILVSYFMLRTVGGASRDSLAVLLARGFEVELAREAAASKRGSNWSRALP